MHLYGSGDSVDAHVVDNNGVEYTFNSPSSSVPPYENVMTMSVYTANNNNFAVKIGGVTVMDNTSAIKQINIEKNCYIEFVIYADY